MKNIQAVRGMKDQLPTEVSIWQKIENILKTILCSYGYKEIRLPIIEETVLFNRAIGTITDVVNKEMYSFIDKNGKNVTLRPEGTAGCVRAGIEHNLLYNKEQRLWYIGPMFRRERPQKGRYRQFNQLGVEVFGLYGPDIDAEIIAITARWWRALGIAEYISLELNSIGSSDTRVNYCDALIKFLEQHIKKLDDECKHCMYINPLRILDSKNQNIQKLLDGAPPIGEYLDNESREHFIELCKLLEIIGIPYTINQRLVRGLDYYNRTVFEWVTSYLGSQNTICAGGRYDSLTEKLGGNVTPAVGLALGLERLILLIKSVNLKFRTSFNIDIYVISLSSEAKYTAIKLAELIRDKILNIKLVINCGGGKFKKQLTRAIRYGARIALIIGESKTTNEKIIVKNLQTGIQILINKDSIVEYLHNLFN